MRPGRSPAPAPAPPPSSRSGRGPRLRRALRFTPRKLVLALVLLLALLLAVPLLFGWWQFNRIERVDVASSLSAGGSGTNFLIVGTDSRDGIDESMGTAGAFLEGTVAGTRADTIMVLRTGDGDPRSLSIPRDLWVNDPVSGQPGRINSTLAHGPEALIASVQQLGIPVNHYMEIDFVSFGGLVDAVGGIPIHFDHPAHDPMSGLQVEETGEVNLDGEQALAYVRSRQYTESIDNQFQTDPTGDLGRVQRQQQFISSLMGEVGSARNPLAFSSMASAVAPGMRIDNSLSYFGALRFVWDARGLGADTTELPVSPRVTAGGASVLDLREPEAAEVIARFS